MELSYLRYFRTVAHETRADEMLPRFIIGEYNFQEDWDAFLDDITGMGLERCVELKQNALDRYYQR